MSLYKLYNKLGFWYVLANDPTEAQEYLQNALDQEEYGFSDKRKVTSIELLSSEVLSALNSKWFFSSGDNLLIVPNNKGE